MVLLILKLLQLHEVSFLYHHVIIILKMFQVHHYEKVDFVDFQRLSLWRWRPNIIGWQGRYVVAQHYLMARKVDFPLLLKAVF